MAKTAPWSILATKEDIKKLEERLENEVKRLESKLEGEVKRLEERMATRDDLEKLSMRLENMISALGARWGIINEETYREGLKEMLRDMGLEDYTRSYNRYRGICVWKS